MNYIGIDLGTTNSVACTIEHGRFTYLNFSGKDLLPSAILFDKGKVTVGNAAKRRAKINADHFIASAKTYMGDLNHTWTIDGRTFNATDVAAEVLQEIFKAARKHFGNNDDIEAVITVPAQFGFIQRDETRKAGERAGFKIKQILAEPVAAALAYGFENAKPNEKIYVVDLGGGTFDVAMLETNGKNYETRIVDGDRALGGDNFDQSIVNLMMSEMRKTIGVDLSTLEHSGLNSNDYAKALQRLYTEAEKVKCALSTSDSEPVDITNLMPYGGGIYDLHMTITRDAFLKEAAPHVRKIENVIRNSFDDSNYEPSDVDRVILVGGSANMPFVRDCVQKFFGKEPYSNMDLSKLVAMGAAILVDSEMGNGIELHDLITHSFGIEVIGNRMEKMLKQNEEYPCTYTDTFYTVYDYQDAVDINAYEGEETEDVTKNRYVGGFTLEGIEKAPAGLPIEVTFTFDKSCILHVFAKEPRSGVQREVNLDPTKEQQRPEASKSSAPYDIVLLLDNSYSMLNSIDIAKDACRRLVTDMIDTAVHRIAFITFESSVQLLSHLTHDRNLLVDKINSVYVGSSTNMDGALNEAYRELENNKGKPLVILVTDGAPDSQTRTTASAYHLKGRGIKIAAIGAGDVDHNYLSSLASSREDYHAIKDMSGLASAFQTITNGLRLH